MLGILVARRIWLTSLLGFGIIVCVSRDGWGGPFRRDRQRGLRVWDNPTPSQKTRQGRRTWRIPGFFLWKAGCETAGDGMKLIRFWTGTEDHEHWGGDWRFTGGGRCWGGLGERGRGRARHRVGHGEAARGDGGGEVSGKGIRAGIRSVEDVGRQRCIRFYCADGRKTMEGSGEVRPCCVER